MTLCMSPSAVVPTGGVFRIASDSKGDDDNRA